MPKYSNSNGEIINKSIIDRKVTEAKQQYIDNFRDKNHYLFCERSMQNNPDDVSHIISVKMCQDTGRCELAWCKYNLELLTRKEHRRLEDMPNAKREEWYHFRRAILERNLKIDKEVFREFEEYYHSVNDELDKLTF